MRTPRRFLRYSPDRSSRIHAFSIVGVCLLCATPIFAIETKTTTSDDAPTTQTLANEVVLAERIDALLQEKMAQANVTPAEAATDAEFLRRAHLDLIGALPTAGEARAFLADEAPGKRARLIAELVDSPGHARHLARRWTRRMLPDLADPTAPDASDRLEEFFYRRFVEGWRYDRLVGDFLAARGRADDGPGVYYRSLEVKPERLAASTARIFLGLQLDCAQCHDHPFDRWTQHDFWGYAAFFARVETPSGGAMTASMVLREKDSGEVMIPESDEIVPPKFPGGRAPTADEGGLRREQLAIWVTARENPFLARAAVNRVWADLFGRGLVEPVDDLRDSNPATHPEVLTLLTDDFVRHGFDLGRVYRILAGTNAYRRSSRWSTTSTSRFNAAMLRAVMPVKVLPPEELFDAVLLATRGQSGRTFGIAGDVTASGPQANAMAVLRAQRQEFLSRMERRVSSAVDYEQGAPQALMMMNGSLIGGLVGERTSGLVTALSAPWLDDQQAVDSLFLATLTRFPTEAERSAALAAIHETSYQSETPPAPIPDEESTAPAKLTESTGDALLDDTSPESDLESAPGANATQLRRREVLSDILWALTNTAEFSCVP